MKTAFTKPSHAYSIVLSKEDVVKLVTGGVLYMPMHTSNAYVDSLKPKVKKDGHVLYYQTPDGEKAHVQFMSIKLERDFK